MSTSNTQLITEFKAIFNPLNENGSVRSEFLTQEKFLEHISEEISKSIIKYMEDIKDDDGDAIVSIAGSSTLKAAIRKMFEYDNNDRENIDPLEMDQDWKEILIETMLSGLTFEITTMDPAWTTKLSSTSEANGEDFNWIKDLIDDGIEKWKNRDHADMSTYLANEIKRVTDATTVFITGLDKSSPPVPVTKAEIVQ